MQAFYPKRRPIAPEIREKQQRAYENQIPLRCYRCRYRWRRPGWRILAGHPPPRTCPLCASRNWDVEPKTKLTRSEHLARQRALRGKSLVSGKLKNGGGKPLIAGSIRKLLKKMVNTKRDGFKVPV